MKINYKGISYTVSDKYSNQDLTGHDLSRDILDGLVIYNSCLSNEKPNAAVLPAGMKNVTFLACNLDNVFIPLNNTVIDCSQRLFKAQKDGEDWLIDSQTLLPIEPLNKQFFLNLKLSIDPANIPSVQAAMPVTLKKIQDNAQQLEAAIQATIDAFVPSAPVIVPQ